MNMHAVCAAAIASAVAVCGLAGPVIAQTAPSFAQTVPSFGQALGNETLDGVVVRFVPQRPYELGLRDDRGYLDTVRLHDKTLMFPIRFVLAVGTRVRVLGFNGGSAFTANEIECVPPPLPSELLQEPSWYSEWDGTRHPTGTASWRNPPAPSFVNPPAPPVNAIRARSAVAIAGT